MSPPIILGLTSFSILKKAAHSSFEFTALVTSSDIRGMAVLSDSTVKLVKMEAPSLAASSVFLLILVTDAERRVKNLFAMPEPMSLLTKTSAGGNDLFPDILVY